MSATNSTPYVEEGRKELNMLGLICTILCNLLMIQAIKGVFPIFIGVPVTVVVIVFDCYVGFEIVKNIVEYKKEK